MSRQAYTRAINTPEIRTEGDESLAWGVVLKSLDPGPDGMISEADVDRIDTHGTFFRQATLDKMARSYGVHFRAMDADHDFTPGMGALVYSVLNAPGEEAHGFPGGAWIIAADPSTEERAAIQGGEHKAFSVATMEARRDVTLTVRETGERLNVEEVTDAQAQYVSFVEAGANREQFTMRSKQTEEQGDMKHNTGIMARALTAVVELFKRSNGEEINPLDANSLQAAGIVPEIRSGDSGLEDFNEYWGRLSAEYKATDLMWIAEYYAYNVLGSEMTPADKKRAIKSMLATMQAEYASIIDTAPEGAFRASVRDSIGDKGEGTDNKQDDQGADMSMTTEERAALLGDIKGMLVENNKAMLDNVRDEVAKGIDPDSALTPEEREIKTLKAEIATRDAAIDAAKRGQDAGNSGDPGGDGKGLETVKAARSVHKWTDKHGTARQTDVTGFPLGAQQPV